jgi:hypothetical protein
MPLADLAMMWSPSWKTILFTFLLGIGITSLELIDRIAALVPQPRTHRHRYYGVLAPNSPLRSAVTTLAAPMQAPTAHAVPAITGEGLLGLVPRRTRRPHPRQRPCSLSFRRNTCGPC